MNGLPEAIDGLYIVNEERPTDAKTFIASGYMNTSDPV